jgi:hypothetical protein
MNLRIIIAFSALTTLAGAMEQPKTQDMLPVETAKNKEEIAKAFDYNRRFLPQTIAIPVPVKEVVAQNAHEELAKLSTRIIAAGDLNENPPHYYDKIFFYVKLGANTDQKISLMQTLYAVNKTSTGYEYDWNLYRDSIKWVLDNNATSKVDIFNTFHSHYSDYLNSQGEDSHQTAALFLLKEGLHEDLSIAKDTACNDFYSQKIFLATSRHDLQPLLNFITSTIYCKNIPTKIMERGLRSTLSAINREQYPPKIEMLKKIANIFIQNMAQSDGKPLTASDVVTIVAGESLEPNDQESNEKIVSKLSPIILK